MASTSLAPRALPCTLYEFALFGDPKPMVVVTCKNVNERHGHNLKPEYTNPKYFEDVLGRNLNKE